MSDLAPVAATVASLHAGQRRDHLRSRHGLAAVRIPRDDLRTAPRSSSSSEAKLTPEDTDPALDLTMGRGDGHADPDLQGNGAATATPAPRCGPGCDVKLLAHGTARSRRHARLGSGDIYFYSPEQLDPKNPGVKNERNLYVYRKARSST